MTKPDTLTQTIDRRAFLRRSAGVTLATAGIGAGAHHMGHGPIGSASGSIFVDDEDLPNANPDVTGWLGEKIAGFFSDDEDLSGYTGSDALATTIEEKSLQLQATNEQILSGLENTVEYADNAAIPTGMESVVTAFDAGEDQDTAQDEMDAAIDEYYAGVQSDILTAFSNSYDQLQNFYSVLASFSPADGDTDITPEDMLAVERSDGVQHGDSDFSFVDLCYDFQTNGFSSGGEDAHDITLEDGSTFSVDYAEYDGSSYNVSSKPNVDEFTAANFFTNKAEDRGSQPSKSNLIKTLDVSRYRNLWSEITDSRDRVYSELSGFVADLYDAYEPGEIDTAEIVDPVTAHTEFRNEIDDGSFRGAHAAGQLGIPRSTGSEPMIIDLHDDGVTVEGSIYGEVADEHSPLQTDLKYYTDISQLDSEDTEEDADGNTVPIDEEATPVLDESPLWIRATLREVNEDGEETVETDYADLEQPFTIVDAVDQDGNEVSQVEFESGPQYNPADIESIEEQLAAVREYQIEQQEEAQENLDSGGGLFAGGFTDSAEGFLSSRIYGVPVVGWLVAVTGVGIYFNGE